MTTATQIPPFQQHLIPLAADLATVQERISGLQEHEAGLKAQIRALVPGPDSYTAGNLTVVVSSNRRWDAKLAAKVIPADLLPLVSVTTSVVDKTKASVLCPAQFQDCFTEYDTKVSLK